MWAFCDLTSILHDVFNSPRCSIGSLLNFVLVCFVWGPDSVVLRGLLLVLCSEIISGSAWGIICHAGGSSQDHLCVRQVLYLLYCLSGSFVEPFYDWIICHCVDRTHFHCPVISWIFDSCEQYCCEHPCTMFCIDVRFFGGVVLTLFQLKHPGQGYMELCM